MISKEKKKMDMVNSIFLTATPILAILGLWAHVALEGFQPIFFIYFAIFYILIGFSITAGYHRLFSHRTYKANPIIKFLLLFFGAGAVENSALKWCSDHRIHHTHCDTEKDPYNIKKGFLWAHIGWIFFEEPKLNPKYPNDLVKDKLVAWQHKYYLPLTILVGFILPLLIGFYYHAPIGGLAIIGLLRITVLQHATFFINSFCHVFGTRPYDEENSARDSFLAALLTFGEGYHNYHHHFQADYRNGVKWYQFDPAKWLIKSLAFLGLASDLKTVPQEEILKAEMESCLLKLKKSSKKEAFDDNIKKLESTFEQFLSNVKKFKKEGKSLISPMNELKLLVQKARLLSQSISLQPIA